MSMSRITGVVDASRMRRENSKLLLRLIWDEQQISRAELARHTGMSRSTVSAIVSDLEASGLVRDIGAGVSRGGRKPVLLGFCDHAFDVVGVELGATHVSVALTDLRGRVLQFHEARHDVRDDPEGALATARALIGDSLAAQRSSLRRVVGVGVAAPSPIRPDEPGRMSPLFMPAWRDVDVQQHLIDALDVPVFVDNDANLGAMAEQWWGAGAGGEDLTYIKVGTGVGSGHIIRGELYRGSGGTAGEIGHVAIDPAGPQCVCGLRGCLATFIGAAALGARAGVPVDELIARARRGDAEACAIIDEAGHQLGTAVAGLLNLLNPAIVVLGGAITAVGELLLAPLRASIRDRALSTSVAETRIVTSELGARAIAIGAATRVLQAALDDPMMFGAAQAATGGAA